MCSAMCTSAARAASSTASASGSCISGRDVDTTARDTDVEEEPLGTGVAEAEVVEPVEDHLEVGRALRAGTPWSRVGRRRRAPAPPGVGWLIACRPVWRCTVSPATR